MENATKALLIAAAILVAILIISLGISVYNMAAETAQGVNLNEQEIMAFNEKFNRYVGENQRGNQVNGLLTTVLNHNINEESESKKVTVLSGSGANASTVLGTSQTTSPRKFDTGKMYKVTTEADKKTGLITKIYVEEKTDK